MVIKNKNIMQNLLCIRVIFKVDFFVDTLIFVERMIMTAIRVDEQILRHTSFT